MRRADGFAQTDAVDGFPCQALRVFGAVAEKPQIAFDEFVAGEAAREGIVLRGVADHAEEAFGVDRVSVRRR